MAWSRAEAKRRSRSVQRPEGETGKGTTRPPKGRRRREKAGGDGTPALAPPPLPITTPCRPCPAPHPVTTPVAPPRAHGPPPSHPHPRSLMPTCGHKEKVAVSAGFCCGCGPVGEVWWVTPKYCRAGAALKCRCYRVLVRTSVRDALGSVSPLLLASPWRGRCCYLHLPG